MKKFNQFLAEKGISEADFTAKSAEEMAALYNEYNEKNSEALAEAVKKEASEQVEALKSEIEATRVEQMKALNDTLKAHGVAIKKLSVGEKAKLSEKSMKEQLSEGLDKLKAIKGGSHEKLSIKAPATMLGSTNISGGNVPVEQRIPGLDIIASREIRLLDIVSRGVAESNIISWVSQANKDGAAGQTAEGALKNQIDFDLVVNSEALKKTTAFIKVSEEMLDDISFIQSEINNELLRETLKQVEAQVYEGDGTGNNHNGIRTVASAFAAGSFAGTVDNANFVDVLRVAINQVKLAEHGAPTFILANPSDVTALKLIKTSTTDKRYIDALQIIAGQMTVDGIPIIETTLVTAGEYLIGNFSMATVYDKGSVSIEVGRDSDDFTKNLVTILAEWRGLTLVPTNKRSAFVQGVIATDAAALETP